MLKQGDAVGAFYILSMHQPGIAVLSQMVQPQKCENEDVNDA